MPSSTRVYRLRATPGDVLLFENPSPVGDEVERCVQVPVELETAVLAAVGALGKGELGFCPPT